VILETPHGTANVVTVHAWSQALLDELAPAERALAETLSKKRREELVAGRVALRQLLPDDTRAHAILPDDRGAPVMPPGWIGSLSHKLDRAAAVVAPAGPHRIGLDLERARPPNIDVGRRVLTGRELDALGSLEPHAYGLAVTLRFSIKEAIYKAIDPFLRRYVGFLEVELALLDGGHVRVDHALPVTVEAWWCEVSGHWLSTARAASTV
jgi:4'-phosphopantetheinyl transferase EntD